MGKQPTLSFFEKVECCQFVDGAGGENMSAFKSNFAVLWSPNLYISLVRVISGTRRLYRRMLEALHITKCNRTVMRWNTPTIQGILQHVKRLVMIETEEMYNSRKQKQANHQDMRPVIVSHRPNEVPVSSPST